MVHSRAETLREIEARKEGIVAILVSPSFLLINPEKGETADRSATNLSCFLKSTAPSREIRAVSRVGKLRTFELVHAEVYHFFRHAIENDLIVPELLAADYLFHNADLFKVYGIEGVPQVFKLRKIYVCRWTTR